MQFRQLHYLSLIVVAQSEIVALSLIVTMKLIYQYDSIATVYRNFGLVVLLRFSRVLPW